MSEKNISITALIPAYNCAPYLAEAIDSVLNQSFRVDEIIIIDNGSTDNTSEILDIYKNKCDLITVKQCEHTNIPDVRNMLVRECTSDYYSFLDADDLWTNDKLKVQVEAMQEDTEMVVCQIENFYDPSIERPSGAQQLMYDNPMKEPLNGALIKHSAFYKVGPFDLKHDTCTEDVDWMFRAKHVPLNTVYLDEKLYKRRIHNSNSTILLNYDSAHALHMIAASLRKKKNFQKHLSELRKGNIKLDKPDCDKNSDDNHTELISFVIPAYNAEKYLEQAVESIVQQSENLNIEILIINNGSDDNTIDIANMLNDKYSFVKVFSKAHGCASSGRNVGLQNIKGDYLMFHDADDIVEKGSIIRLLNTMKETNCDVVKSKAVDFVSPEIDNFENVNATISHQPYGGALTGCVLIKRNIIDSVGLFDENLNSGETIDYLLRISDVTKNIVDLDIVSKKRRVHDSNTVKTTQLNYASVLRKRLQQNKLNNNQ